MIIGFFSFSKEFFPTGNKQVENNAKGKVAIYNKTGSAQTLVKTTRLLSVDGILFRMATAVTVPARGEAEVDVYADQKGSAGNIGPASFIIPGLSLEKQKVIYAESKVAMSGGTQSVGVLSSDDLNNAKTEYGSAAIEEFLRTQSKTDGMERVVLIGEENLKFDHAVGDEVGSFVASGTSTMLVAEFRAGDVMKLVNQEIRARVVDGTERYLSLSNAPRVTLANVDLRNGLATLDVRDELVVTLDADSDKLSPDHFFGKSRDEISRYVMSLDHVANVDVSFFPSWVLTAPSAEDHISVVVKSVR